MFRIRRLAIVAIEEGQHYERPDEANGTTRRRHLPRKQHCVAPRAEEKCSCRERGCENNLGDGRSHATKRPEHQRSNDAVAQRLEKIERLPRISREQSGNEYAEKP